MSYRVAVCLGIYERRGEDRRGQDRTGEERGTRVLISGVRGYYYRGYGGGINIGGMEVESILGVWRWNQYRGYGGGINIGGMEVESIYATLHRNVVTTRGAKSIHYVSVFIV